MNFIKKLFKTTTKKMSGVRITGSIFGWMERNPKAYVEEGYKKCSTVYRCIDLIQQAIGSIEMHVSVRGITDSNHPLKKLLDMPNPVQSGNYFWGVYCAWNRITGNSFIEKVKGTRSVPSELWLWPSINMRVVGSKSSMIPLGYIYLSDTGLETISWDVDTVTGVSDIIHWKTFNPDSIWVGMAPIEASAYAVDQNNSASAWNQAMLKNGSVPDGILWTEETLTDDQFTQIKTRLKESYTGERNAHASMILEGGLKWQQLGLSPKDMDWVQGKNISAREIASTFGVPDQLVPIPGSQTFANYEQAKLSFWTDTILPLMDQLVSVLNTNLSYLYGSDVKIYYDIDSIPALEPLRAQRWQSVQSATWLSINEKREATGYDRLEDDEYGSLILVPSGNIPLEDLTITIEQPNDIQNG